MIFHSSAEEFVHPWILLSRLMTCLEQSLATGIVGLDAVLTCINIP